MANNTFSGAGLLSGNIDMNDPIGALVAQGFSNRGSQDRANMGLLSPNTAFGNMFFESAAGQANPDMQPFLDLILALGNSLGPDAVESFLSFNFPRTGDPKGALRALTVPDSAAQPNINIPRPGMF